MREHMAQMERRMSDQTEASERRMSEQIAELRASYSARSSEVACLAATHLEQHTAPLPRPETRTSRCRSIDNITQFSSYILYA